ncbi:MAG: glycine cleavage system protein GcvH [Sediminibacterium sp.]|nr:glycine cleavage system protein GcvH [Sediminibacterium sp.]
MNIPQQLLYTAEHEWVSINEDFATVGITDFAQSELGDIVYVETKSLGKNVTFNEIFGNVEAAKAASDLFMPIAGTIVEFNEELNNNPDLVNKDPYGSGWIIKVKLNTPIDTNQLLSAENYLTLIKN